MCDLIEKRKLKQSIYKCFSRGIFPFMFFPVSLVELLLFLLFYRSTSFQFLFIKNGVEIFDCFIKFLKCDKKITDFAVNNNTDLLIIGTHGLSGTEHFLIGSTMENVV